MKGLGISVIISVVGVMWGMPCQATPEKAREMKAACAACHVNPAGGAELTDAGKIFQKDNKFEKTPTVEKEKAADFIGTKKCKMCHGKQYESWAKTSMAHSLKMLASAKPEQVEKIVKALEVTLEGKPDQSPLCLVCHVTGYGLPGGYTAEKGAADILDSISCEECHGPGSLHLKSKKENKLSTINGHPGEAMCRACHTQKVSHEFKFEEEIKKGVHAHFPIKK